VGWNKGVELIRSSTVVETDPCSSRDRPGTDLGSCLIALYSNSKGNKQHWRADWGRFGKGHVPGGRENKWERYISWENRGYLWKWTLIEVGEAVPSQCHPYSLYVQLSRSSTLGGIMLLSKVRERDFVGNNALDSTPYSRSRREVGTTMRGDDQEAECWNWSEDQYINWTPARGRASPGTGATHVTQPKIYKGEK
jgi:hypothetical protein